ncbi:hypothetical protein, partial [Xanthomonas oryzae]|uniref:hypothetical protein n=1 Tax=Xanthomonas oryzae TaxID=347 RepID=UPI001C4A7339
MHPAFGLGTSLFEGVNQYFSSLLTDSLARLVSAPKASLTTSIQGMERPVDQWPVNAQGMPEQVRHSRSVVLKFNLISPDPQLDFCCSPANSFVLPMFSM